jgi:hypothetical protein
MEWSRRSDKLTAVHVPPGTIWSEALAVVAASNSKLARMELILNSIVALFRRRTDYGQT